MTSFCRWGIRCLNTALTFYFPCAGQYAQHFIENVISICIKYILQCSDRVNSSMPLLFESSSRLYEYTRSWISRCFLLPVGSFHIWWYIHANGRGKLKRHPAPVLFSPLPAFRQMIERFAVFYPSFAKRLNDIWNSVEDGYR